MFNGYTECDVSTCAVQRAQKHTDTYLVPIMTVGQAKTLTVHLEFNA